MANGGTGSSTLAANNVLLGNGTSAPLTVAPGSNGNVLTSNGSTWVSLAPASNSWTTSSSDIYRSSGNVGIGTTSPSSQLSVGSSSQFQINATGDLTKVNNVAYSWPSTQGSASTVLTNAGNGTLSWASAGGGLTSCPSGFTMVGTAGKRGTFCIDSDERTAQVWFDAKDTCLGLNLTQGEAFMCDHNEWYKACKANPAGLTNMTNNWEWVAEFSAYGTYGAMVAGSGGCSVLFDTTMDALYAFRCCVR